MRREPAVDFEWDIRPLDRLHNVRGFDCGEEELNLYLRRFAEKHAKQGISRTYVASPIQDPSRAIGYFTISTGAVAHEAAISDVSLPRFPIPVVHIGRLAVSTEYQNLRIFGPQLLAEVYEMVLGLSDKIGCYAIDVIAKTDRVKRFYEREGFTQLRDGDRHLWLRLKDIRASRDVVV